FGGPPRLRSARPPGSTRRRTVRRVRGGDGSFRGVAVRKSGVRASPPETGRNAAGTEGAARGPRNSAGADKPSSLRVSVQGHDPDRAASGTVHLGARRVARVREP